MTVQFPFSQFPLYLGAAMRSSSDRRKKKSTEGFEKVFCFLNKWEWCCWCQQSSTANLVLSEKNELFVKQELVGFSVNWSPKVPKRGGYCDVLPQIPPSGFPNTGSATGWQFSFASYLQEWHSSKLAAQCHIPFLGCSLLSSFWDNSAGPSQLQSWTPCDYCTIA